MRVTVVLFLVVAITVFYKGEVEVLNQLCVCSLTGCVGVLVLVMLLSEWVLGLFRPLLQVVS